MTTVFKIADLQEKKIDLISQIQQKKYEKNPVKIQLGFESCRDLSVTTNLLICPTSIALETKLKIPGKNKYLNLPLKNLVVRVEEITDKNWEFSYEEIENAIGLLIQSFEGLDFQDCSVCLEKTSAKTNCRHPLCNACFNKMKAIKMRLYNRLPNCPICRKQMTEKEI
jgi:hypothetical protein